MSLFILAMMKRKRIRLSNHTDDDPTFTSGLLFSTSLCRSICQLYTFHSMGLSLTNERNIRPLYWHSDLDLLLPPDSNDIVFRFLAGLANTAAVYRV